MLSQWRAIGDTVDSRNKNPMLMIYALCILRASPDFNGFMHQTVWQYGWQYVYGGYAMGRLQLSKTALLKLLIFSQFWAYRHSSSRKEKGWTTFYYLIAEPIQMIADMKSNVDDLCVLCSGSEPRFWWFFMQRQTLGQYSWHLIIEMYKSHTCARCSRFEVFQIPM